MSKRKISDHFYEYEMQCKCGKFGHTCAMDSIFMTMLEKLRESTGPLYINSGFRCNSHNSKINGVVNSWHTKGRAADCVSKSISLNELESLAKQYFAEVIRYPTFVHIAEVKNPYESGF